MLTKKFGLSTILLLVLSVCFGQTSTSVSDAISDMDSIVTGSEPLPKMLIVGSFHFGYYNLDAHKTDADEQVDVLSEQRQQEMDALVAYISAFKPTKIAVESGPVTGYLLRNYEAWLAGERSLARSETEQIGFRLMKQFNLDTIYGVNAVPMLFDWYDSKDSTTLRPIFDSVYQDWDFQSNEAPSLRYDAFYEYDDKLALKMTLLDYFTYMNNDKVLRKGYGSYLTGDFKLGTFEGADALAMHWYNRNLRIYRNLQRITTSNDDRVLLIIGAGHAQILTYLFECSNEFELVKFDEIGK